MKVKPQPLISQEQLQKRVYELAQEINRDFQGQPLMVVGVLKGSFIFTADLVRHLNMDIEVDFIRVASYDGTSSTGNVQLVQDIGKDIHKQNVLLVEDIVDTGQTLDYLKRLFSERQPKSLSVCTCLSKPSCRKVDVDVKYVGFEIPNKFVVGYGLDYNGAWRQFPAVHEVES